MPKYRAAPDATRGPIIGKGQTPPYFDQTLPRAKASGKIRLYRFNDEYRVHAPSLPSTKHLGSITAMPAYPTIVWAGCPS